MFFLVALLMLFVGSLFQGADIHIGIILSQVLCIALPAYFFRKYFNIQTPILRGNIPHWKLIVLVVVATPVISFSANLIALLLMKFSPTLLEMGAQYESTILKILHPDELWRQILGFAGVCLIAPLSEEYFFRGTLLQSQKQVHSWGVAILINALLFSLVHANPLAFISLALVGAYFASLAKHGLFLSILAHAMLNTTSGVMSFFQDKSVDPMATETVHILIALALLVPLSLALWFFTMRVMKQERAH